MNLELPKQVIEILNKLEDYGYSAYIYGECVRLLIKGQASHSNKAENIDFDVMTNAEISRIRAIFDKYNVIEDNLPNGELIVTVLGVAITITQYIDLELELRNKHAFTFDAIAYSNKSGFFASFNWIDDLNKSTLNFIHTDKSFNSHDIMPALAWQSNGEFAISDSAKRLILSNTDNLISNGEDFASVLMGRNIEAVLNEYSDIFFKLIPELTMLNSKFPELLSHTFKSVGSSTPILTLRYALLFHELGKPDCHSINSESRDFFYGHAERSRIYATRIMTRLECSQDDIQETGYIIENYQKILHADKDNLPDLCDNYPAEQLKLLLLFNCADYRANTDKKSEKIAMKYKKLISLI